MSSASAYLNMIQSDGQHLARSASDGLVQSVSNSAASKNYINEVIHRQHRVTLDEFIEICAALDMSPMEALHEIMKG